MQRILITGASGLIGKNLSVHLSKIGFEISHLTRTISNNNFKSYKWDIKNNSIDEASLNGIDYIIHLAGAGIADKRWTEKRKKEIIDSRVKSAELLYNSIAKLNVKPKAFISASAIGYYGAVTSDKIFNEKDSAGSDFLGKICKLWEESSLRFENLGIRTVQLRFGVVLSKEGGALKKMLLPTKLGIGSALGSGKQYFPWVHIEDTVNIIFKSINDNNMNGPYNVVAPVFTNYIEFAKTLAKVMEKPFFMPNIPSFFLRLILGEMSKIILEGSRVSSKKIENAGFTFKFTDLNVALNNLLK